MAHFMLPGTFWK